MIDPNEHQEGGTHYRLPYQPWDLILFLGLGYIEGNALKYVIRWRKKGGLADLKKSLHYINKLEEASPIRYHDDHGIFPAEINKFAKVNGLTDVEHSFVLTVALWEDHTDLDGARKLLELLMEEASVQVPSGTAATGC